MNGHQPESSPVRHVEIHDGAEPGDPFAELRHSVLSSELRARRRSVTFEPLAPALAGRAEGTEARRRGVRIVTGPWLDGLSHGRDRRRFDLGDGERALVVFGVQLRTRSSGSAGEEEWRTLGRALRITVIDDDSLLLLDDLGIPGSIVADPLVLVSQHRDPDLLARRRRFLVLAGFLPVSLEPIVLDLRNVEPSDACDWLEKLPAPVRDRLVVIDDALSSPSDSGPSSSLRRRSVKGVIFVPAHIGVDDVVSIIGGASLVLTDDQRLAVVAESFDVEALATTTFVPGPDRPPFDLVGVARRRGTALAAAAAARLERQREASADIDILVRDLDAAWAREPAHSRAAVPTIEELERELEALRAHALGSARREAAMRAAVADRYLALHRELEEARADRAEALNDVERLESMLRLQSAAARREIGARLASSETDSQR